MTVPTLASRNDAVGNGSTPTYDYDYKIFSEGDLRVIVKRSSDDVEFPLVLDTDYTVDPDTIGMNDGGTITLIDDGQEWLDGDGDLASGYEITIRRVREILQQTDVRNQGPFNAVLHEDAFDHLIMVDQQQQDELDRSFKLPETEAGSDAATILPSLADRASNFLAFDASGNPIAAAGVTDVPVSAFMETVLDDATAAAARTTLGVPSNAEAILDTLIDAKGDLIVGTAADTAARKAVGSDGRVLMADSGQSDGLLWQEMAGYNLINGIIAESRAANAVTYAVKTLAGADPSTSDPVYVIFRDAAAGTGGYVRRKLTAALSFTWSSGSTGGATSAKAFKPWLVIFDDAGTLRMSAINCRSGLNIYPLGQFPIASSTAEGGAGGADSAHVFYTSTAVTSKAYAIIGYVSYESGLSTAGTWDAAPTRIQLYHHGVPLPGQVIQDRVLQDGAGATGTGQIPSDNSIPQNTEGDQYLTDSITPISAAHLLDVQAQVFGGQNQDTRLTAALFRDSVADALVAIGGDSSASSSSGAHCFTLLWRQLAESTSSIAFKVRAGPNDASTFYFNGLGNPGTQIMGGVMNSFIRIKEIAS